MKHKSPVEMPRYSGKCSHLSKEEEDKLIAEGREPSIRFRVPKGRNHQI
ncbi:hypothetical protein ACEQPO_00090 [Bacillus sp. SL00103]